MADDPTRAFDDAARSFYDDLATDHDPLFPDRDASIRALDDLLRRYLGVSSRTVLDCACGIGTQVLGLAALGHRVVGSDLSLAAVARARLEARITSALAEMRRSCTTVRTGG